MSTLNRPAGAEYPISEAQAAIAARAVHRCAVDEDERAEFLAMLGLDGTTEAAPSSAARRNQRKHHPDRGSPLTETERATLHAYREIGSAAGVAKSLSVTERTVHGCLRRIRLKTGADRNAELLELDMEAVA